MYEEDLEEETDDLLEVNLYLPLLFMTVNMSIEPPKGEERHRWDDDDL